MKPRFINETGSQRVELAIVDAERLLDPVGEMIHALSKKHDWKFNTGNGEAVFKAFLQSRKPIPVRLYSPWNPWTKAIGYYDGKAIYINKKKLPAMSHENIVSNLCHEFSHYAGFSHGDNYKTVEKCKFSVPYFISENIEVWL